MNTDLIYTLGTTTTVVFNKHGALIAPDLEVVHFSALNNYDEQKLINLISALAENSDHHLSSALHQYTKNKNQEKIKLEKLQIIPGKGIRATYQHLRILLGSLALLEKYGVRLGHTKNQVVPHLKAGYSVILLAVGEEVKGYIAFKQKISKEAIKAIDLLNNSNITTILLTGDNHATANYLSSRFRLKQHFGNFAPEDKENFIQHLQQEGHTVTNFTSDHESLPDTNLRLIVNEKNIFATACLLPLSQEVVKSSHKILMLGALLIFCLVAIILLAVIG